MSATKERLNEATKGVREGMRLEKKKGQEFTTFVMLMKASHMCKQLAAEPGWSDKQRKNLNNSAKKADEGIQRQGRKQILQLLVISGDILTDCL